MYADAFFHDEPVWSQRPGRRLAYFLLPASIIVVAALSVFRLPVIEEQQPLTELLVRILASQPEKPAEPTIVEERPVVTDTMPAPTPDAAAEPAETGSTTDWYALLPAAAEAAAEPEPTYSANPAWEQKRRQAAEQFRPSRAPVAKPIWENVEKDNLGRTLLVSGNCYMVIDDPNVGSRDAFLTFGQFIAMCSFSKRTPKELPFVREIQSRREALARYERPAAE